MFKKCLEMVGDGGLCRLFALDYNAWEDDPDHPESAALMEMQSDVREIKEYLKAISDAATLWMEDRQSHIDHREAYEERRFGGGG